MSASVTPTIDGGRIFLMSSFGKLVTIEPTKGQVLKTVDLLERFGVQPNPPLYEDGMVYTCSGAGAGGQMLALANEGLGVRPKWKDKMLDCQMHGLVSIDGYIYGTAQSGGNGLVCLDLRTIVCVIISFILEYCYLFGAWRSSISS